MRAASEVRWFVEFNLFAAFSKGSEWKKVEHGERLAEDDEKVKAGRETSRESGGYTEGGIEVGRLIDRGIGREEISRENERKREEVREVVELRREMPEESKEEGNNFHQGKKNTFLVRCNEIIEYF